MGHWVKWVVSLTDINFSSYSALELLSAWCLFIWLMVTNIFCHSLTVHPIDSFHAKLTKTKIALQTILFIDDHQVDLTSWIIQRRNFFFIDDLIKSAFPTISWMNERIQKRAVSIFVCRVWKWGTGFSHMSKSLFSVLVVLIKKPRWSATSFACSDAQFEALTQSKKKLFSTLIKHRTCSCETMRKKEENVKKKS